MNRRHFLQAGVGAAVLTAQATPVAAVAEEKSMTVAMAADPFALELKDALKEHLESKGHTVLDVGAQKDQETPFYDGASAAAKLLQSGEAQRGILLCGTGAGMCIVANKFKGVTAVCVESVFSARMARAINNSNVLTMGAMIVAPWMAKEMVDVWMDTRHTKGLEQFADFLKSACARVNAMDGGQ